MEKTVPKLIPLVGFFFVIFLFIELFLRFGNNLLPMNWRNLVLSKYNTRPDGIYFKDKDWNISKLKPNFEQEMFYNGYNWRHKSNAIGIRNDKDIERADIVVLGDSFVYGHGVNNNDTFCYYLQEISGRVVANLGIQGDYPLLQYIRLKYLALFLKPKIVLFFINGPQDEADFLINWPAQNAFNKAFSEQPQDYSLGVAGSDYLNNYRKDKFYLSDYLSYRIFTVRLIIGIVQIYRQVLNSGKKVCDCDVEKTVKNYMRKIISDASRLCKINSSGLIVVFQANEKKDEEQWAEFCKKRTGVSLNFNKICRVVCADLSIPVLDLGDKTTKEEYFIKNDYHYSPTGNKWVADSLYNYLKTNNFLD